MIITVTGHRKLGTSYYNPYKPTKKWSEVTDRTTKLLSALPDITDIRIGGAIGGDTMFATVAHNLNIPYSWWMPGEWQPEAWPTESQDVFDYLRKHAEYEIIVDLSPKYSWNAMKARNTAMVNGMGHHSASGWHYKSVDSTELIIGLWNPKDTNRINGTGGLVKDALSSNIPVISVFDDTIDDTHIHWPGPLPTIFTGSDVDMTAIKRFIKLWPDV